MALAIVLLSTTVVLSTGTTSIVGPGEAINGLGTPPSTILTIPPPKPVGVEGVIESMKGVGVG